MGDISITVLDFLVWALYVFIIGMVILSLLVIAGKYPRIESVRKLKFDDSPDSSWECTIKIKSESVFAVNQILKVQARLKVNSEDNQQLIEDEPENPSIDFPGAVSTDGSGAVLNFEEENGVWKATQEITYLKPGRQELTYSFIFDHDTVEIGEIDTERGYFEYKNQKYSLLFAIVTSILAAGSLLIAVQTM